MSLGAASLPHLSDLQLQLLRVGQDVLRLIAQDERAAALEPCAAQHVGVCVSFAEEQPDLAVDCGRVAGVDRLAGDDELFLVAALEGRLDEFTFECGCAAPECSSR